MMRHIHLIGIGGTGLSAIARVLIERGYKVSGSDNNASIYFDAITALGATTYIGHSPENVVGADLVVRSSAIADDNPEVLAARSSGIPVLKRSDFLKQLTEGQTTLAIAGTHGKTTTTGMLISILTELKQDPSFIIGAMLKPFNSNAKSGSGSYFVIEADEYDHMFLGLTPYIAVITNIEHDHPDCFPTPQDYLNVFKDFLGKVEQGGTALFCIDDPGVQNLMKILDPSTYRVITYGLHPKAEFQATNIQVNPEGLPEFDLVNHFPGIACQYPGHVKMSIPGEHNVRNGLAALAVSHLLGLDDQESIKALAGYQGTERRFEIAGVSNGITVIDDYAHHPTQIHITLQAARQRYPSARLWVVWEPHTYSRPAAFQDEYVTVLNIADQVIVTKIYAAREADTGYIPLPIVNALSSTKARYLPDFSTAVDYLADHLAENDVVLVLSAGNGPIISKMLVSKLNLGNINSN
jgi:UDP-N-acetylmuramate--alanine ligase